MQKAPVRILRVVSIMNRGGIESQIMNIYRNIDREKYQFDFLVTRDEEGLFDKEILSLGGKIYRIPSIRETGFISFVKNIDRFFGQHNEFKIVHCHMNTWSGLFLNIAKRHKVPVRIAQSHSAQKGIKNTSIKGILENNFKNMMRMLIKYGANHFWAVGNEAGEWLYGKRISQSKLLIVPNAKELDLYKFNSYNRERLRKEMSVSKDTLLIGHVGSFSPVKNHDFLLEVSNEMKKENFDFKLCFVGDGVLRKDIEGKVAKRKMQENVIFLGLRNDVNKLMSAFDILVLPSKFEGMPNVVIEAQAASLKCVISNSITKEVDMGIGLVKFFSLCEGPQNWKELIRNTDSANREIQTNQIKEKGYDLNNLTRWLENFYSEIVNEQ